MRHSYISSSLILLGLIAGCAEVTNQVETQSCNVSCRSDQVCKQDVCYDTCSINKLCTGKHKVCLNNLCTDSDVTCAPDTRRCAADGRTVEHCADGIDYEFEKTCSDEETCELGVCIKNACDDDTFRCKNNNVEICRNHSFTLYSECEAPQVCVETSFKCEVPPECTNGIRRCDENGNVQICDNEHWVAYQTCKTGYSCSNSSLDCVETASCENGSLKCNDNSVYECVNAQWKLSTKCGNDQICEKNRCVSAECTDGQQRCFEAGTLVYKQACVKNAYQSTPCKSGEICLMNGETAECVKNECETTYQCENNKLYKCSENIVSEAKACKSNEYCDASAAECKPKCGNGVVDVDAGEECDASAFRSDLTCSSKVPNSIGNLKCTLDCKVDASGCTLACDEGETRCDGSVFKKCFTDAWTSTDCAASGQKCSPSGCYKPSYTGNWDYVQDFEDLKKVSSTYSTTNEFTDSEGISWSIKARTDTIDNGKSYSIDGQNSVILHAKNSTYIKFDNAPQKVVKFEFDWRSWGGNNDKGTLNILVNGKAQKKIEFTQNNTEISQYTLDINDSLKSVELSLTTANSGRIIIDNIRWTYH